MSYIVPSACALALLVGGVAAINPTLREARAYATTDDNGTLPSSDDSSIALNITGSENIDSNGSTTAKPDNITYRSYIFNISGTTPQYAVTLNAANGYTGELKGKDHQDAIIRKVTLGTFPKGFVNNTWGYAITSRNETSTEASTLAYNPVPAAQPAEPAILAFRGNLSGTIDDSYKLTFAVRFGKDSPSDHYQTSLYLSVIGNAAEIVDLGFADSNGRITEMQQMDASICDGAAIGATDQLRDSRDGKLYWVTKLKDGNCWMTQNLDFDVPVQLSNASSDVMNTTLTTNTIRVASPSDWLNDSNKTNTYNAYFDPGDYIYDGPDHNHSQGESCSSTIGLEQCEQFSLATTDSDLHYHIGNYYSYSAATVKSGDGLESGNAAQSICPKGWQLPTSNSTTSSKSFGQLFAEYNILNTISSVVDGKNILIYDSPLYFVYGGYFRDSKLVAAGYQGRYWSSTIYDAGYPYMLGFSNILNSSDLNWRYIGHSVRCAAE